MDYVLSRDQIRYYDRLATDVGKIPGLLLMENAGRAATDIIMTLAPLGSDNHPANIAIICGTGNNGGDGFVVARHLKARGFEPAVYIIGDPMNIRNDARIYFDAMLAGGIACKETADLAAELESVHLIVDALFGTGLSRDIDGAEARVVDIINQSSALRVSLDIPSGLDADTGAVLGRAVKADHTATFAYPKPGIYTPQGRIHCGQVHTVNLGVPDAHVLEKTGITARLVSAESIHHSFHPREATTHKYKAGNILVVAGSRGKTGAAKLVAEATLRAGAGLATICTWPEAMPAFEKELKEIMLVPLDTAAMEASLGNAMARRSAIVIGPGLGTTSEAGHVLDFTLRHARCPVVIDADAITLAAGSLESFKETGAEKILTPHAGELGRLLGINPAEVETNRFTAVSRAAHLTGAIIVLKGAHTIIATPRGELYICREANPVLATAGSGDVLAGIIGAFSAGMNPVDAACAGVYVHAAAGNLWTERNHSDRGMLAGDLAGLIPGIIGKFTIL